VAHGDWALAYNAGRLVSAAHALTGVSLVYEYNALGQRVRKTVDDNGAVAQTRFLYDLGGRLIAETDAAGTVLREYLWLGDTPVGFVAQAQGASDRSLFFVHADHLDTARVITDASGQVAWQALREPFGATTVLAGNTLDWPLRFPGQYLDSETGWHYNYYRDYDPQTGRYIESDPIGLRGGINTYAYVGGNPVGLVDPLGLAPGNRGNRPSSCGPNMKNCDDAMDAANRALGIPKKGAKPREKKQIGDVCKEYKIPDRDDFGDYLEREYKPDNGFRGNDTMSYDDLRDAAETYLEMFK
jgi:RHS repeat-associated protein